mmetsp:Transcript_28218/g.67118  ORF Transcript_28218/g.67118 Transcript_28218/m.67118 type:complete len:156 (+) Transcript_28218:51-518(+)
MHIADYSRAHSTPRWPLVLDLALGVLRLAALLSIDPHHDGIHDSLQLLLLRLMLPGISLRVLLEPLQGAVHGLLHLGPVLLAELVLQVLPVQRAFDGVGISLQLIPGLDVLSQSLVLLPKLLRLLHHPLNLIFGEATLLVCDGDLVRLSRGLVCR